MRLRTKFALVLLVMTVVLSASVYGGLELYKDQLVAQSQADVDETATLTAEQLDRQVDDRADFVGFVASRPEAADFNESDRFLRQFVENSRFFAAQLIDRNGTVVDFHGDVTQELQQESIGSTIRDRPYVETALDGEIYISEPEYATATEQYLVVYSAPVFEDREVTGVLAAAIYLDQQTFFGVLGPISRNDQHVIVRAAGRELYASGNEFEQSITATRPLDRTGWSVTISRDRSALDTQLRELAIGQGLGILLIMLSVISFGVWEYRTTLAQTRRLLEGFGALEDGDYDHELALAAATEWEQISAGFNALADSLDERESALRQREQRLQVLNRVLRHNLRNSTSIIIGYAGMLRRRLDDERHLEILESIEDAGNELTALSEKARQLEFTVEERPEGGVLDVALLVEDVVADIRAEYPSVDVTLRIPDTAPATADAALSLAIANLCENACEHSDADDPRLEVVVRRGAEDVLVEISDNGAGIPEYERSVIDRGEETPLEHGSGLGLWVAEWAIQRSGGELDFERRSDGGSTVRIRLDAAAVDELEPVETAEAQGTFWNR